MTQLRDLAGAAADLFLGNGCVGCGRPGPVLCPGCRVVLEQPPYVAWPTPRPAGLPPPFAVTAYDGVARAAVNAHKEQAVLALAGPLGRALALSVLGVLAAGGPLPGGTTVVRLVPPPSSAAVVRERSHDPLERMVAAAVRALRSAGVCAAPARVLERARAVADQAGLSAGARSANLSRAFRVRPRATGRLAGQPVVVVDDVITTGATAAEVARAVAAAGAQVLGVAVVAATRRRTPESRAGPSSA